MGRTDQIGEVRGAVDTARLVSLIGVGGVGKSRLATAIAAELEPDFRAGVAVVDLGAVTDARHLPQVVRDIIAPASNQQVPLADTLAPCHMLIVMDGCEHLAPDVAPFISNLLENCPDLHVLVTSRLPLAMPGEHLFHVPPLRVATEDTSEPSEAAELFRSHARAATGQATTGSLAAIEELCRRLDGLPLAIELAAIRARTMSVTEMLAGINNRFALLRSGTDAAQPRSIDAVLKWTWEQCSTEQRRLWADFSIFVGSVSLGAITEICGFADTLEAADVIDGLVQRSLLIRDDTTGRVTFRMLDTIAAFGADMLRTEFSANGDDLRRVHARYYASISEDIAEGWFGAEQPRMSEMLRTHMPNLRAAYAYCLRHPELADLAVDIFRHLWTYWVACGYLGEGRVWSRQLLLLAPPGYERALWVAGWVELLLGDLNAAEEYLTKCHENASTDDRAKYISASLLAACHAIRGDFGFAASQYQLGIEEATVAQDTFAVALLTQNYAELITIGGDVDRGMMACDTITAICDRHQERWIYSHTLWVQALGAFIEDKFDDAIEYSTRSLQLKSSIYDLLGTALVAEVFAWARARRGNMPTAAIILGATSDYWKDTDRPLLGFARLQESRMECMDLLSSAIDESTRSEFETQGSRIGLEGLATLLSERTDLDVTPAPTAVQSTLLTRRELEVAQLVSVGLSNKLIAERLFISTRTVETHVAHILAKFGLARRGEISITLSSVL
ncbi:MAG TPA: LuxR C-terminal-related transcriptional regulator [Mycobacterium sp.]